MPIMCTFEFSCEPTILSGLGMGMNPSLGMGMDPSPGMGMNPSPGTGMNPSPGMGMNPSLTNQHKKR